MRSSVTVSPGILNFCILIAKSTVFKIIIIIIKAPIVYSVFFARVT